MTHIGFDSLLRKSSAHILFCGHGTMAKVSRLEAKVSDVVWPSFLSRMKNQLKKRTPIPHRLKSSAKTLPCLLRPKYQMTYLRRILMCQWPGDEQRMGSTGSPHPRRLRLRPTHLDTSMARTVPGERPGLCWERNLFGGLQLRNGAQIASQRTLVTPARV